MSKSLRTFVRAAAIIAAAYGASACSTMSDLNPFGGDDNTDSQGYPVPAPQADNNAPAADNTATSADNTATSADNAAYPSVASVPAKPAPAATPQERTQVADALVADRSRAQYSADALRGGTEAAAPPPPPAAPQTGVASLEPAPDTSADNGSDNSAAPASSDSGIGSAVAPAPAASSAPAASLAPAAPSSDLSAATEPAPSLAAQPNTQVASLTPPSAPATATAPAISAARATGAIPGAEPAIPADAPLAFNPSSAPPLDSSISQFVPESVLARYQATQAEARGLASPTATTKVKVTPATQPTAKGNQSSNGGSGVFVNLDAIGNGPGVVKTSAGYGAVGAADWRVPGQTPTGVVFFPASGSGINAAGEAQIRAAAEAYEARGKGYVRVIGHSASRTGNMPLNQHIAYVFKESQKNATAVAQALIKAGVPANAVIVEAVGDTQPVYYESMPQGEDGNRRTEIFIEG